MSQWVAGTQFIVFQTFNFHSTFPSHTDSPHQHQVIHMLLMHVHCTLQTVRWFSNVPVSSGDTVEPRYTDAAMLKLQVIFCQHTWIPTYRSQSTHASSQPGKSKVLTVITTETQVPFSLHRIHQQGGRNYLGFGHHGHMPPLTHQPAFGRTINSRLSATYPPINLTLNLGPPCDPMHPLASVASSKVSVPTSMCLLTMSRQVTCGWPHFLLSSGTQCSTVWLFFHHSSSGRAPNTSTSIPPLAVI